MLICSQSAELEEDYQADMVRNMKAGHVTLQVICMDDENGPPPVDAEAAANRDANLRGLQGIIEETGSKDAKWVAGGEGQYWFSIALIASASLEQGSWCERLPAIWPCKNSSACPLHDSFIYLYIGSSRICSESSAPRTYPPNASRRSWRSGGP